MAILRINYNLVISTFHFNNNSNVAIDVIILTFYSDQLVIDVETGIVTKYFFYNMVFFVRVFLIPVKRPYVQLSSPGQTEGWVGGWVGGGMGGCRDGWMAGWVDRWVS